MVLLVYFSFKVGLTLNGVDTKEVKFNISLSSQHFLIRRSMWLHLVKIYRILLLNALFLHIPGSKPAY